ncbi:prephenate dehydratase [Salegentibacter mishustinae]|uniref:prephenate dehydratase n=1 Tax=Salegentibacter mishustinae TaxID=270918 RepID=A0A0Q9ZCB8_9FLAO|nr:prephenate dehydratase [Salegentibacter mishustinae]KRG30694.1 prephenate dehydratase [Salegentibacter mishustinae]PNW23582.1 prephenate dehydratase [Salegentibacter mishustinae]PZX66665.1 prephenate dehydratase [Salegentibacter mishustinae]GGW83815.1 prephenate dehydratase [Salegentibacter mishustinae]
MDKIIAIQGVQGSFHHLVAQEYYHQEVEVLECMSFAELTKSLIKGEANEGVMAIENSIAGSILPNYALIDENNLKVVGEHYIPIDMNFMAMPGQKIENIKKVYSHPMALLQCKEFFKKYPHIKLIEDSDTAEVARRISEKGSTKVAAVASKAAAQLFGLEILAESIHTKKSNATRFLIISTKKKEPNGDKIDKASLKFELESKRGSLVSVLNILRDFNLDMTKIQSMPIIEFPWKYSFFIDVIFENYAEFQKAMDILEVMTERLTILGTYKNSL